MAHPFGTLNLPVHLTVAALKVAIGLLALGTLTAWHPRLVGALTWLIAGGPLLYGMYEGGLNAMVATGLLDIGKPVGRWYWYYALVWGPYWLLGGLLFLATAIQHRRSEF